MVSLGSGSSSTRPGEGDGTPPFQKTHDERARPRPEGSPRIGRFFVLEHLGRGGGGQVYAAYDKELDRKIAIKLLLDRGFSDEPIRARFRREAQALARLSHPNVVTVYEVGEDDGELFLAMEVVRGRTIREWLEAERPDWPIVVDAFAQAGRGLAAAHRAGLVHRDFKPHNVMWSDEGVAKVLDFGVARLSNDESDVRARSGTRAAADSSSSLTAPGKLMGTPAYASPEQLDGTEVDARSDQFSFCVSLFEALYGRRPTPYQPADELLSSILRGAGPSPAIPTRLRMVLLRGLEHEPEARWPSMDALLDALAVDDPRRRRRRRLLGAASIGVLGLGVAATWWSLREPPCSGAAQRLEGIWDEARSAEVESAMLGIGKAYASDTWTRTRSAVDAYAEHWVAMHTEACEANVRAEQSPRVLDLRMQCLRRAAVELRATVDVLAQARTNAEVVQQAHELTAGLPALERCADVEGLQAEIQPPTSEDADAVEATRLELARTRSLLRVKRLKDAEKAVNRARELLGGTEYPPVQIELLREEAEILDDLTRFDAAEAKLVEAMNLALRYEHWDALLHLTTSMMFVVGARQKNITDGLQYWPMVRGLSQGRPAQEARGRNTLGQLRYDQGDYDEAERQFQVALQRLRTGGVEEQARYIDTHGGLARVFSAQGRYEAAERESRTALALAQQRLGPAHPDVAHSRSNLAVILAHQGRQAEAEAEHRAAIVLLVAALGPTHLRVARTRINLANTLCDQLRLDEGEVEYRAGISAMEQSLEPDHPDIDLARVNLASALGEQRKDAEAEAELRTVLSRLEPRLGPDHPNVAKVRSNLAASLVAQSEYEEAEVHIRGALAVLEETLGPAHPVIGQCRRVLGDALHGQQRFDEAQREYRTALAGLEKALGPKHPFVIVMMTELSNVLLQLERLDEALLLAERAWSHARDAEELPRSIWANNALALSRALWTVRGSARDRERARQLAREVSRQAREEGDAHADHALEAERWLVTIGNRGPKRGR